VDEPLGEEKEMGRQAEEHLRHLVTHLVPAHEGHRWEVLKVGSARTFAQSFNNKNDLVSNYHLKKAGSNTARDEGPSSKKVTVRFVVTATTVDGRPLQMRPVAGRHSKQPFLVLYNDDGTSSAGGSAVKHHGNRLGSVEDSEEGKPNEVHLRFVKDTVPSGGLTLIVRTQE
jgi:hypothetical protein